MAAPPMPAHRAWHPHPSPLEGSPARTWVEIAAVLLVSLGASAIWAIVQLIDRATRPDQPLGAQSVAMNTAMSDRAWVDVMVRVTGIVLDLAPVLLVCWLLWRTARPHLGRLGITWEQPWRDTARGAALVLVIGIPGLALYWVGRQLGVTLDVTPSPLDAHWWTIPLLVLSAIRAGVSEEVIVIGYLFERLRSLGWGRWPIIVSTAVLRGTYHLYQGPGAFVGNVLMGILFGWLYTRTGRLLPLVIAHILIDCAVFIGYPWAHSTFPWFFA